MFGGTILVPILIGFDPNVALLCSGIGTLIYLLAVGGRMPSYLGSSGAFIAVVIAATAYPGQGANPNIAIALGGIIAAGVIYTLIGVCVVLAGPGWIEKLMPPVVVGTVVAVIGLNLAPFAVKAVSSGGLETIIGLITVVLVGVVAVHAGGFWRRIPDSDRRGKRLPAVRFIDQWVWARHPDRFCTGGCGGVAGPPEFFGARF